VLVTRGGGEGVVRSFVCVFFQRLLYLFEYIPKLYSRGSKIRGVWVGGVGVGCCISLSFITSLY
jgi:hypothetical protein